MSIHKFISRSNQKGYLMMVAVILIVIVAFLGSAIANIFFGVSFSATAHYQSDSALYLAQSGLEHAAHKILEPTVANRLTCDGMYSTPITNTFGAGSYSVTISPSPSAYYYSYFGGDYFSPTRLTSAITSSSTSIPVGSTSGYGPSGRIMIDKELINYEGTTGTSFTNITRGVDGTVAAAHASNTAIAQYECILISTAGVPNLTSPQGKRQLVAALQLQDVWVVGDANSSSKITLANYNYPNAPNTWWIPSQSGTANLYGVNTISNADMWFVGSNYIEHWDTYTNTPYTPPVNVSYRSVYCNSSNDCHSVGDASGGLFAANPTMIRWTGGSNWSQLTPTSNAAGNNLKSVHCDSSSDCWAVGDVGTGSLFTGNIFYHWTGASWAGATQNALSSAFPFYGVFCNSASDCWAVGSTNTFGHLTSGTTFTAVATGMPSVQYNSVFCNSTSDCWAVGNVSGLNNVFVHWNGTAWSQNSSNPSPLTNLNGVACLGKNDCWAIGSSVVGNNGQFFHWDGTSWTNNTNITPTQTLNAATLRAISVVPAPTTQPITAWSEKWG